MEALSWYKGLSPCTRLIFTLSAAIPLFLRFQLLSPFDVILSQKGVINQLQLWRLVSSSFVASVDFNLLMNIYFRFSYTKALESQLGSNETLFFTLFSLGVLDTFSLLLGSYPILSDSFTLALVYLWSVQNPTAIVTFYFGIQFAAQYLPAVLIALDFLMAPPAAAMDMVMVKVLGILTAHLYYVLRWPVQAGVISNDNGSGNGNNGGEVSYLKVPNVTMEGIIRDLLSFGGNDSAGTAATGGVANARSPLTTGHRLGR